METSIIKEIGLTEKEANIYLTLIKLGSSSASEIIRETGFHRAIIYDNLDRLLEKGLVSFINKGRKKFFEAVNPNRLLELEKEKQQKLKSIIKDLKELSTFSAKLDVKLYKGKDGLINVFEDIISSNVKEWLVLGSSGKTIKILPYYLEHFQRRRAKKRIKTKALMIDNESGRHRGAELKKLKNTEVRYLPKQITTPTVIQIYGNKTIIHSNNSETPFVVVIDNRDISSSFKEYFFALWKIAK